MRKKDADSVLSLRLPAEDADRLQREARLRGVTISRLAREALARGLVSRPSMSYGVSTDAPLSIFMVGIGLPETRTIGGLALDLLP